ncbi:MAG: UDP-glucose 4-epimerase GalE [Devosia sp.]
MDVLVVGGAGYIGAHVAKAVAAAGHRPVVYDNLSTGHKNAVRWGPFVEGDLADVVRLDAVMAKIRPTAIIHLAAVSDISRALAAPIDLYRANVVGSLNLIERAVAHEVRTFVFSSSCAVYGQTNGGALTEAHPQHPINSYGETKRAIEAILEGSARAYGLNSVALRYFNAAGASADGEIGEDHTPETHLIPNVLRAAQDPDAPLTVNGTDYGTADGTAVRDFIHVEDLARAHVSALERLSSGELHGFCAVNLGSGAGASVREVVSAAEAITGRPVAVTEGERREGDADRLIADASLAQKAIGWRPARSDLDTMIETAWRWHNR